MSSTFTSSEAIHALTHAWTGTVNNSQSVELSDGVEVRRNLFENPNFETNTGGITWSTNLTVTRDTTTFHSGSASMRVVGTGANAYGGLYPAQRYDLVPGATYTWSFYFMIPADLSTNSLPQMAFYNGTTNLGYAYVSSIQFATDWQRQSITFTVPDGTTRVTFLLHSLNSPTTTDVIYFDDIQLEQSPVSTDYFDGSTPGTVEYGIAMPSLVTQWAATSQPRHIVHDVLGTPWPNVTIQPAGPRSGTMSALFDSEDGANDFFTMLRGTNVITFSDTDTYSTAMVFLAQDNITMTPDDQDRRRWVVSFGYMEVQE
ncbi:carbohydrate binding domain-containing protein [Curtobacterium sp. MCBA15_008]|uniref:phage head spike fiber domain-containing protein n=1 Tax=Curtobacterium sp. MCBA15_008 TaxID=1898736 RepID=UPI0008DD265D|nr:carbohydrate binding domain-containing protein [Curtobacterium sp. MCBA15_008]OII04316.1 hypothetical protein BIU96_07910 [Curtobacterium sp. MCBA15_008]